MHCSQGNAKSAAIFAVCVLTCIIFLHADDTSNTSDLPGTWKSTVHQTPNGESPSAAMHKILLNKPSFVGTGDLIRIDTKRFEELPPFTKARDEFTRGWDNEAYHAIHHYFWGCSNGIVLEMGALDGKLFSVSNDFVQFGWHRILIEGTPTYWHDGVRLSSDATYVGAAICNTSEVHYVQKSRSRPGGSALNGIAEFMAPTFLRDFFPWVYKQAVTSQHRLDFNAVQWHDNAAGDTVLTVQCAQLRHLFRSLEVRHINFAVIDVEGAELNVLATIDFSEVIIDVLCVETDPQYRSSGYRAAVRTYLETKGFVHDGDVGRNSWFHHPSFTPVRKT